MSSLRPTGGRRRDPGWARSPSPRPLAWTWDGDRLAALDVVERRPTPARWRQIWTWDGASLTGRTLTSGGRRPLAMTVRAAPRDDGVDIVTTVDENDDGTPDRVRTERIDERGNAITVIEVVGASRSVRQVAWHCR